jgi:hypothetical protein
MKSKSSNYHRSASRRGEEADEFNIIGQLSPDIQRGLNPYSDDENIQIPDEEE